VAAPVTAAAKAKPTGKTPQKKDVFGKPEASFFHLRKSISPSTNYTNFLFSKKIIQKTIPFLTTDFTDGRG
jgi:hypothetical protein